jgi:hypothetical protein
MSQSLEEALSMPILKLLDLSAECRLSDVQAERSFTESELLCNGYERNKVTENPGPGSWRTNLKCFTRRAVVCTVS